MPLRFFKSKWHFYFIYSPLYNNYSEVSFFDPSEFGGLFFEIFIKSQKKKLVVVYENIQYLKNQIIHLMTEFQN